MVSHRNASERCGRLFQQAGSHWVVEIEIPGKPKSSIDGMDILRRQVERQTVQSETLREQVERLDGQVTSWTDYFGTLAARSRGRWI